MIGETLRPVSRKMWQFHLNINIEGTFWRHAARTPDVISDVINIKSTFLGLISDGLSISNVKMNLSEIFRNLQNGRHFEAWANF